MIGEACMKCFQASIPSIEEKIPDMYSLIQSKDRHLSIHISLFRQKINENTKTRLSHPNEFLKWGFSLMGFYPFSL